MRILLSTVCILAALLISHVNCQEEDAEGGEGRWSGLWQRFKAAFKNFARQVQEFWNELRDEVRERAGDMSNWSTEMWTSFKKKMFEWIDGRNDVDETEKGRMRDYIERLQMEESE